MGDRMREDMINLAKKIAIDAHKKQTRRDGTLYINHPKRVASSFTYPNYIIVAWLHDVLEDTTITAEDLIRNGIPKQLVATIQSLTRRNNENYYDFIMRIKKDFIATKVKIADINDNITHNLKEGFLKDKYRLAKYVLEEVE